MISGGIEIDLFSQLIDVLNLRSVISEDHLSTLLLWVFAFVAFLFLQQLLFVHILCDFNIFQFSKFEKTSVKSNCSNVHTVFIYEDLFTDKITIKNKTLKFKWT